MAGLLLVCSSVSLAAGAAPELDLSISYYTKVLTREGVLREARYAETMLRRADHVWTARVLPAGLPQKSDEAHRHGFNSVTSARHVALVAGKPRLEYVDVGEREVVEITPAEYDNVGFDGSWDNAYCLVAPEVVATLPMSDKLSAIPGARWREQTGKGVFQRVLWDEARQLALVIESGDLAGTYLRRVEVTVLPGLVKTLPWERLQGYAHRDYADFLD